MVAAIDADAYPFLVFSELTCSKIQQQVLSGCAVPPDKKKNQFGSNNQEACP